MGRGPWGSGYHRCLSRQSSGCGSPSRRFERNKMFLPHPCVNASIVGSLHDREVACSTSDRRGSNFESCVWRTVSSHHPQEVRVAQFSLYVHKGGLKPDSFHFITHPCDCETLKKQYTSHNNMVDYITDRGGNWTLTDFLTNRPSDQRAWRHPHPTIAPAGDFNYQTFCNVA